MRVYNPYSDINRPRRKKVRWRYQYTPFTIDDVQPFDLLFTRQKSFIAAAIIYFSGTEGKRAWLAHVGQVMADGRTVSEASFPEHEYTPIEEYFEAQKNNTVRLTLCRLSPVVFPDEETKQTAYEKCEAYHRSLVGRKYELTGLFPMLLVSVLRGLIPFLKRGRWENIPKEKAKIVFICSGITDKGWAWAQRVTGRDWFPSSLSLLVSSPQDQYEAWSTQFKGGWRKVYATKQEIQEWNLEHGNPRQRFKFVFRRRR